MKNKSIKTTPQGCFKGGEHKDMFKTVLDNLVTAGTITSDKETTIETVLSQKDNSNGGEHKNMFKTKLANLVTAGTITSMKKLL